jgi:mannose-6-phosphate isomerase class I
LNRTILNKEWRKTTQHILPETKPASGEQWYDIYPAWKLDENLIYEGFEALAESFLLHRQIIIDGYVGVFYDSFRKKLDQCFKRHGVRASWKSTNDFLMPHFIIDEMISPFLGGDDPLFGKRTSLILDDFFDIELLRESEPDGDADINIIIGPGASLAGWKGLLVYIDLPKNEIQYRSRAGSITNLGASVEADLKSMYKRFYFVDWIVLNKYKQHILNEIDVIVDGQRPENPLWMSGETLRLSLSEMSRSVFRLRPWFEPGTWGGTWIKDHIKGLSSEVPNYAWSFELIVPENGLLFESSGRLLEVSFDFLMYLKAEAVLGNSFERCGTEFPIRFDFLDTFDGGNLSIQCHPGPDYMKTRFGENFGQEETYYILDTKEDARVYLGFQDDIDSSVFRKELENSFQNSKPLEVEKFVQKHKSTKHDLFLIPYGTIHGSGKNNLVLEISSTPYIFTFKMYDWLRPDLDGKPRPLNIQRGMENLCFDRKGGDVKEKLISKPVLTDEGKGWRLYNLPTHPTHLYGIHRFHISESVEVKTENDCHVLSLVEGSSILIGTENGVSRQFSYGETFVIPAAARSYRIINKSSSEAIVIKAFVK